MGPFVSDHYGRKHYSHSLQCYSHKFGQPSASGTLIAIESPDTTDDWSNDMAVFRSPKPAIPVQIDKERYYLPEVPADEHSDVMHGFVYNSTTAKLFDVYFVQTNCIGDFCDALFACSGDNCACFTANKREANIVAIFSMTFETKASPGNPPVKIQVKNFTSKKFTKFIMKGQKMPSNIQVHNLNSRLVLRKFMKSVDDIFAYVNTYGGYDVEGWVKRGMIVDQGVDQPLGNRSQERKLNSALAYHATSIVPSIPLKNLPDLDALRFDLAASIPAPPPRSLPNVPPTGRRNNPPPVATTQATVGALTNGSRTGGSGPAAVGNPANGRHPRGGDLSTNQATTQGTAAVDNPANGIETVLAGAPTPVATSQNRATLGAPIDEGRTGGSRRSTVTIDGNRSPSGGPSVGVISPPRAAMTRASVPGKVSTGLVRTTPPQILPPRQTARGTVPGQVLKSPMPVSPPQGRTVTTNPDRASITQVDNLPVATATTAKPKAGIVRTTPPQILPPRQTTRGTVPGQVLKSPTPVSPPQGRTVTTNHDRAGITQLDNLPVGTATTAKPKAGTMSNKQDGKKKSKRTSKSNDDQNPKKLTTEQNQRRATGKSQPKK